ncbi:MAG TPA: tyrosine-type recombinase/integrase [Polyangia bacterium]|nr:tyrosine-type recombinase/integrase [Polyangia bacterium]
MLDHFYGRIVAKVRECRLSADLEALGTYLRNRGHRSSALSGYMCGAAHLAACIDRGLVSLDGLTADGLQQFARDHVRRCSCPRPRTKGSNFVSVARHFYEVLQERHGLAPAASATRNATPVEMMLARFDEHLRDDRGLREASRETTIRQLERVLGERFGSGPVDLACWIAEEVRHCVVKRTEYSLHAAKQRANAMRSLFRFLALEGESVAHLVSAIPVVRRTRFPGLPRGLSEEQLGQLRRAIDVKTAIGLRAKAIIECLVTLGLRAGEVAALRLNDIDWHAGTLRVTTSKVRRGDILPLPAHVGRAVAAYLRRGRPVTKRDRVFVRHYMPVGQPLHSKDVTSTVTRAFRRAGLRLPSMGAHVLRHTTASRLVRAGVNFKQVADIMRHRDIDTTLIYTKVDWPRLAEVALPWPTAVVS